MIKAKKKILSKNKTVPKKLQGILWSVNVGNLSLEKNKSYIINQILSFGTMEEIKWLFKNYPKEVVRKTFIEEPAKIYSPSAFNYAKNILLGLDNIDLPLNKYDRTLPRNIRS